MPTLQSPRSHSSHFIYPTALLQTGSQHMNAAIVLHVLVLLVGSVLFSVMYENILGRESFSLPFVNITLVTLVGAIVSVWYGWTSTLVTLAVYGACCALAGYRGRAR